MKKLLAIINEPENSKDFVEYAANLTSDLNLSLELLFVQNPEAYPLGSLDEANRMTPQLQKELEELVVQSENDLKKVSEEVNNKLSKKLDIKVSSEIGITKFIVEKLVSENAVHAVILDTKEDTGFWAQNSTNMDIVQDVDCPIWIVPFGAKYEAFKKIVYATNYKEADISTLKKLIKLTKTYKPDIVALHITDTKDFEEKLKTSGFLDNMQDETGYNKISVEALLERENDDIAQLINNYSADMNANLMVVLKENRNFFERVFKSSSTKKLIKDAKLPILVFHEKEE